MNGTFSSVKRADGSTVGIGGATTVMAKSVCKVICHMLLPFFVEYFRVDLLPETTANVVANLVDVMKKMEFATGVRVFSFISDSFISMRDVRRDPQLVKHVKWSYSCVTHCLKDFREYESRLKLTNILRQAVFFSESV